MLFFSRKLIIQQEYEKWAKENQLKDCAINVIAFLADNGMLNEDAAFEYCKGKKVEKK